MAKLYAWKCVFDTISVNEISYEFLYTTQEIVGSDKVSIVDSESNQINGTVVVRDSTYGNGNLYLKELVEDARVIYIENSPQYNLSCVRSPENDIEDPPKYISNIDINGENYLIKDKEAIKELKTINGNSLLGAGDITIGGGGGGARYISIQHMPPRYGVHISGLYEPDPDAFNPITLDLYTPLLPYMKDGKKYIANITFNTGYTPDRKIETELRIDSNNRMIYRTILMRDDGFNWTDGEEFYNWDVPLIDNTNLTIYGTIYELEYNIDIHGLWEVDDIVTNKGDI